MLQKGDAESDDGLGMLVQAREDLGVALGEAPQDTLVSRMKNPRRPARARGSSSRLRNRAECLSMSRELRVRGRIRADERVERLGYTTRTKPIRVLASRSFSVEDEESEAASKGKGKQQPAPKQSRVPLYVAVGNREGRGAASARPDSS
jgi:hypothetical protein